MTGVFDFAVSSNDLILLMNIAMSELSQNAGAKTMAAPLFRIWSSASS
ncbi:MAG: hypothetical protein ACD_47C00706G0001 [uncultured bacterium]|nr:MAG: hypothetical protein ACD_47C00706G0001 [uncultured bacterium]